MKIEVGDTVQLTASLLMKFQQSQPDLFQLLIDAGISYGQVTGIEGDNIEVQLQPERPGHSPVRVTLAANQPHLILQVVRKADGSQPAAIPNQALPSTQMAAPSSNEPPHSVQMAQWVFTSFLQFKQFGIIQDLQRRPDTAAPGMGSYDASDKWQNDPDNLRAVRVSLTDEEDRLYHTAMERIRLMMLDDVSPAVAKVEGTTD